MENNLAVFNQPSVHTYASPSGTSNIDDYVHFGNGWAHLRLAHPTKSDY